MSKRSTATEMRGNFNLYNCIHEQHNNFHIEFKDYFNLKVNIKC